MLYNLLSFSITIVGGKKMENKKEPIVVKAERPLENKDYVQRIEISIEDGKIKELNDDTINLSELKAGSYLGIASWSRYTPEEEPFIFRESLYIMLDIWEKDKNTKAKEELLSYLSQEEIEKYFGKYARPASFYIQRRVEGYRPVDYTIRVLDGKIFEIKKEMMFPSFKSEISILKEDEIKDYLSEVTSLLVFKKGWWTYKKFLSCLCKEELEKYFVPSYSPK